jgi:hypothetical protein
MFVVNVEKKASFMERLCAIHAISDSMMVREDEETTAVFCLDMQFSISSKFEVILNTKFLNKRFELLNR